MGLRGASHNSTNVLSTNQLAIDRSFHIRKQVAWQPGDGSRFATRSAVLTRLLKTNHCATHCFETTQQALNVLPRRENQGFRGTSQSVDGNHLLPARQPHVLCLILASSTGRHRESETTGLSAGVVPIPPTWLKQACFLTSMRRRSRRKLAALHAENPRGQASY